MKTILSLALLAAAVASQAVIVDFEGVDGLLSPGYGGVADWGTWNAYSFSQPPYSAHSGPGRAYQNPVPTTITFGQDVHFSGAYFAGYSTISPVYFDLYYQGSLVHTSSTLGLSDTPTWLSGGYSGLVDQIEVHNGSGGSDDLYLVMDDFTYNPASAVPAPAAILPFALGLAKLRRRRA